MLNVRMTEEERAALKKDAHHHEMTVSEYVRWLILQERKRK